MLKYSGSQRASTKAYQVLLKVTKVIGIASRMGSYLHLECISSLADTMPVFLLISETWRRFSKEPISLAKLVLEISN